MGKIVKSQIVDISQEGLKIAQFKERTIEHFSLLEAYGFLHKCSYDIEYPEISLWKLNNIITMEGADFLITNDGNALWPKFHYYNYCRNIPMDKRLVKECNGVLSYKPSKQITNVNCAFSLIGVYADIWAHAIVEYYPKLTMLEQVLSSCTERITVLVPDYKDKQLRTIIMDQLMKYDVDIMVVKEGEAVRAQVLYYIQRPTIFCDHCLSVSLGDISIPKRVMSIIKEQLVCPYIKNLSVDKKYKKLFLVRRGGFGKGIINSAEIESLFKAEGFVFIEPHKVPLEEKVRMFYSADIVVGPMGSAFTNLIFCRPQTKVLIFSNYQRLFDPYFAIVSDFFGLEAMNVCGEDDKNSNNPAHCSFYMPVDKVIEAAKSFNIIK